MNNDIKYNFAVVGGDMRQSELAASLSGDGHRVRLYGFDTCAVQPPHTERTNTLKSTLSGADCVILPLPCSTDGVYLNAPFCTKKTRLNDVYAAIDKRSLVFGGNISGSPFSEMGLRAYDYFKREELAVLNAVPTAEGAVQLAMEELPKTLHSSKCLVVGYGRIGKTLSAMLRALNAEVTVTARKPSDLALIGVNGMKAEKTADIEKIIEGFDIVFNTVPAPVITKNALKRAHEGLLIIDLASKPGGVDFDEARICGVNTIWALSLPGKVACKTAGEIIKQTVMNILAEVAEDG